MQPEGAGLDPDMDAASRDEEDHLSLLEEERLRTLTRIAAFRRTFEDIVHSTEGSPPDDEHDPDGATVGFERAQVSALLTEAEEHLAAIDTAVVRVRAGTYGTCDGCGGRITKERLAARPATTVCVNCA